MVKRWIVGGLAAFAMLLPSAALGQPGLPNFRFSFLEAGKPVSAEEVKRVRCVRPLDPKGDYDCMVRDLTIGTVEFPNFHFLLHKAKLKKIHIVSFADMYEELKDLFTTEFGEPCRVERASYTLPKITGDEVTQYDKDIWCFATGEMELLQQGDRLRAIYTDTGNTPGK